jgi:hypothetical protein
MWYLPFVVAGPFAMFRMQWEVDPGTLLGVFTHQVAEAWPERAGQAVVVGLVGCVVVWLIRGRPHSSWLAALVLATTRVLTDPIIWKYYEVILLVPAVAGLCSLVAAGALPRRGLRLVVAFTGVVLLIAPHPDSLLTPAMLLTGAVAVVVASLRRGTSHSGALAPALLPGASTFSGTAAPAPVSGSSAVGTPDR